MAQEQYETAARREPTPSASLPPPSTTPSLHRPGSITKPAASASHNSTQPASLAKRILFPHLSPDETISPLFASSATLSKLDDEVYDFIALALRAFVNPWWTKLSRYDKDFLPHITSVLGHVLRTVETRVSATDISPLVLHDIPLILNQHYIDYRSASAKHGSAYAAGGAVGMAALFHAQQQHMGITSDGVLDDVYIRTAVDSLLKICLPPEDWESEPERHIVREVIVMVICNSVVPKITQGWFIQKFILDLMGHEDGNIPPGTVYPSTSSPYSQPSAHALIVFFLSALKTISSAGLTLVNAYKQMKQTIKFVNSSPPHGMKMAPSSVERVPSEMSPPVNPVAPRLSTRTSDAPSLSSSFSATTPDEATSNSLRSIPKDFSRPTLILISTLFSLPSRLASSALFVLLSMVVTFFSPFLDKLLPYLLYKFVFVPTQLVGLVANAKRSLFPNGYPAQSPLDPTPEEQAVIRDTLAACIDARIPSWLSPVLLGPPGARERTIGDILDPIGDQACNAHLFLYMFDAVLLYLFPEMGLGSDEHTDLESRLL